MKNLVNEMVKEFNKGTNCIEIHLPYWEVSDVLSEVAKKVGKKIYYNPEQFEAMTEEGLYEKSLWDGYSGNLTGYKKFMKVYK